MCTVIRNWIVVAMLGACSPSQAETGSTTTDEALSSSSGELAAPTTGDLASTTAASNTTGDATTGDASTTAGLGPCACPADEICVNRDAFGDDRLPACEARPPGCDPSEPCSPACAVLCGPWECGAPLFVNPIPDVVYCPDDCDCADDELCILQVDEETFPPRFFCAVPPVGCDPQELCSEACAQACPLAPMLPAGCDGDASPVWLDCGGRGSECSLWAQNCAAGEKCDEGSLRCVPEPRPAAGVGSPCEQSQGVDNCEKGAVCFGVDPDSEAMVCVPHCGGSGEQPECPDGTICSILNEGSLTWCSAACDPLAPNCGPGMGCFFAGDEFACVPEFSGASGAALDPCEFANDCDDGLVCVATGRVPGCVDESSCCTPYCDLDAPACALPGTSCVSLFDYLDLDPPPEFAAVGYCGEAP